MIAAASLDDLCEAIKTTASHDAQVAGCYTLPGLSGSTDDNSRAAVPAFIAYRRTVRARLSVSRDGRRPRSPGEPRTHHNEN